MTNFKLLNKSNSIKEITYHDEYINSMKSYERSLKMETSNTVSITEYTEFLTTTVLDFSTEEKLKLEKAIFELNKSIDYLNINNPSEVFIIKTNGLDEWNSAYTRRNIIILPEKKIKYNEQNLFRLLAHEFFHVYSRVNPVKRNQLYELINFKAVDIEVPSNIKTLTNPDTLTKVITTVNYKGKCTDVTPVITANKVDSTKDILNSIKVKLYSYDLNILIDIEETDYLDNVINSNNPQHPDEILAENFTHLVSDKFVKNRKLIEKIEEIISNE